MTTLTTNTASTQSASNADYAALILRVTMGVWFLAHAWLKIAIFTPAGTVGYFQSIGLPGFLAYVTIAAELLGGLALIAGFKSRIVSLALIPILLGAAWFGHGANGFFFSNANGGWEFPVFWAVALAVQALLGDGAMSLGKSNR
jgi:putative oxidoreductase